MRAGDETRPTGTTIPCAQVIPTSTSETSYLIRETDGILVHLEEILGPSAGFPSAFGSTTKQRARVFDIVSLLHEAMTWYGVYLVNSDPNSLSWSGLAREEWSDHTAGYAKRKHDALLEKLEKWIEDDAIGGEGRSLVGEDADCTIANFFLLAVVEYSGTAWVGEHEVLKGWCERARGQQWWIGVEGLAKMERDGLNNCGVLYTGE